MLNLAPFSISHPPFPGGEWGMKKKAWFLFTSVMVVRAIIWHNDNHN